VLRHLLQGAEVSPLDRERVIVNRPAHEFVVEGALTGWAVNPRELDREFISPSHQDTVTAFLPEQEFQQALGITQIQGGRRVVCGKHAALMERSRAISVLKRQHKASRMTISCDQCTVRAIPQRCGQEIRV
jgi:hypothetical protein